MADLVLRHIVQHEIWWSLGLGAIVATPGIAKYYMPIVHAPKTKDSPSDDGGPIIAAVNSAASILGQGTDYKTIEVTKTVTKTNPKNDVSETTTTEWKTTTGIEYERQTSIATTTAWYTSTETSTTEIKDTTTLTETVTEGSQVVVSTFTQPTRTVYQPSGTTTLLEWTTVTDTEYAPATSPPAVDPQKDDFSSATFPHNFPKWESASFGTLFATSLIACLYLARLNYKYRTQDWYQYLLQEATDAQAAAKRASDALTKAQNDRKSDDATKLAELEARNVIADRARTTAEKTVQKQLEDFSAILRDVYGVFAQEEDVDTNNIAETRKLCETTLKAKDQEKYKKYIELEPELERRKLRIKTLEKMMNDAARNEYTGVDKDLTERNDDLQAKLKKKDALLEKKDEQIKVLTDDYYSVCVKYNVKPKRR